MTFSRSLIAVATSAWFVVQANAECNCNYSNIVAYVEFPNEAEQQPEVPPCSQYFVVKAYPTFGCIGWEDALALPDLEQSKPVVNRGCNKRQEWVEFTFTNTCRHGKTVPRTARVRIDYGPSGNPDVGKTSQWVDSLHWVTELGFKATGRSAGRLRLEAATLSSALLTPAALFLEGNGVLDFVPRSPNEPSVPRQLLCPETFVDIVQESDTAYRIDFFKPSERDGTQDVVYYYYAPHRRWRVATPVDYIEGRITRHTPLMTNQIYRVPEEAVPFVRHRIEDPDGTGTVSRLRITTIRPGLDPTYVEYSQSAANTWRMDENGVRTIELSESRTGDEVVKIKRVGSLDATGAIIPVSVNRTRYRDMGGRLLPIEVTEGDEWHPRTTLQTFFDDHSDPGRYGILKSRNGPDGNWIEYELDDTGRIIVQRESWLSGVTNDPCRKTVYSYAPLFQSDNIPSRLPYDDGSVDPESPRCETVFIGEVPVRKLLRSVVRDSMGYRRIEEVQVLDPTETDLLAAWTAQENPHRLSIYMPKSASMPCSMLPWLVVNPDGTATSYDYISGDYVPGADGTPGVFTQVRGGPYFRTIATHGTAESFGIDSMGCSTNYAGIPLRTTRDVKIELRTGKREVLRETQVCNASGGYETVAWTTTILDDLGRVVATRSSDGSRTENEWIGDRLVASTDADGIRTTYAYDGLGREISSTYTDPLTGTEVVSSTTYDAVGRALASTTTAGSLSQSTQRRYDSAGRLVWSCGPDGIENTTSYGTTNGLRFVATTRGADGLFTTSATYSYADGQTAYVERNGKRTETYEYGYADGLRWTIAYEGPKGTNSPVWTASVSDALGRTVSELRPGFGGSILETSYTYNAAGQLLSSEEYTLPAETTPRTPRTPREILALRSLREINPQPGTLRSRTLNLYDSLGALRVSASDVNLNGTIDFAGPDIVSSNETAFAFLDSTWWQESSRYSFPDTASAAPLRVSTTRTRLSGLGVPETTELGTALLASETLAVDALGNAVSQKSYRNRAAHTAFDFSTSAASALSAWSFSIGGHSVSNRTATGILSSRAYDALGRVVSTTDGRGNVSSYSYDERGRLSSSTDATGATTAYGYDVLGRQTSVTNALGLVTTTSYDLDNNITAQGGAQYPVWYSYDDYGRMRAMTTFRTEDLASGDVTTWHYDEATGLMTNKVYADGKGPTYTYTPDGKLARRIWARGVATDYAYDGQGRLVSKNYSDSTPDVSLTYDRLGHTLSAVCAGVSTNLYDYNRLGQLTNEMQNGTTIARSYDALGRPAGYSLADADGAVGAPVVYGYDAVSRVSSVSSGADSFSYSYFPGTDDVAGMESNFGFSWTRTFEPARDVLAVVSNVFSGRHVSAFAYSTDAAGRRTDRFESGAAFGEPAVEEFDYDHFSQVVGSHRYHADAAGTPISEMTGRAFGYTYDGMGNRLSSAESAGELALETIYSPNALNQYDAILHPGYVTLRGAATNGAIVSVNGVPAESSASAAGFVPWSAALATGDPAAGSFLPASVLAVLPEAEGDVQDSAEGFVFAPPAEEALSYDADGNLLSDGRYIYAWDGENRLVSLSERVAPTNRAARTFSFRYEPSGRLVSRVCSDGAETSFRWLDHVVVLEEIAVGGSVARSLNLWGVDISETLGGAAGIGGLLSVSNGIGTFYPTFDGSGNISEYLDRSGDVAAHYEYSPFGETLVREGDRADEFAYRFSTKAVVPWTSFYYYGSRFYSPVTGRWLNRDPMRENGGLNLYAFIQNTPANAVDIFGYEIIYIGGAAEEFVGTIDSVKSINIFDFVSTWDNPPRVIGEKKYRTRDGWKTKKIYAKDGEITEHIKQFVQSNPCKPIVLVGHSYGGDTAFDIAKELKGTPCLCLYIITLDAVSRFDSDVWYRENPKNGTPVIEWINVYQEEGWEDDLNATPVLGHVTGALWAFAGLVITPVAPDTGSDLIASGGGQWNKNSGADINLSFKNSEIAHRNLFSMLRLTIPEKGISVWKYAEELNQRSCCESGGSENE